MYDLKSIENDFISSIKELVSEFQLALNNKNVPFPFIIRIWKNSDNQYEPTVSHFFKGSDMAGIYYPTFGTSDTPEKALQVAISWGIPKIKTYDSTIEYEENLNF